MTRSTKLYTFNGLFRHLQSKGLKLITSHLTENSYNYVVSETNTVEEIEKVLKDFKTCGWCKDGVQYKLSFYF